MRISEITFLSSLFICYGFLTPKMCNCVKKSSDLKIGRRHSYMRVIGGFRTERSEYPWIVLLRYFDLPFCGGTIVNPYFVVTAAHCVRYFSRAYTITTGSHLMSNDVDDTEQIRTIDRVESHPGFNSITMENDIALIKLNKPLKFNEYTQPAKLANASFQPESEDVVAIGWGSENAENIKMSEHLNEVTIHILPSSICQEKLRRMKGVIYNSGIFCAGGIDGKGTCFGDSGSPVHSGKTVYGISSATSVCARKISPAIYTKISHFANWIESRVY